MCSSRKMLRRLPVLVITLGLLVAIAACARKPSDARRVDEAIDRLKSGEVVAEVEQKMQEKAGGSIEITGRSPIEQVPQGFVDPCPDTARSSVVLSEEGKKNFVTQLGACLRAQMRPVEAASVAIHHFQYYAMDPSERPLSSMTDSEILEYVKANFESPLVFLAQPDPRETKLRGSYSDAELVELQTLVARKRAALAAAEAAMFGAVDARDGAVRELALKNNRYAVLVALRDTAGDTQGLPTAMKISDAVSASGMDLPKDLRRFPTEMLHPYAILSVVPDEGFESFPLDPENENPFMSVAKALGELAGPEGLVEETLNVYKGYRDLDNPKLPEHEPAAKDAVRVAFIDSGIDWVAHPDLGLFLGNGENGSLAQGDFTDGDKNPWIPSEGILAHGSGTSATLLTILAHYAPEVLKERKLDLAMWKTYGIRDFLAGPASDFVSWNNRLPVVEAIVRSIDSGAPAKVVSVSMGFGLQRALNAIGKDDLLRKAPWLWVMAAGNGGVALAEGRPASCFSDVPAEMRRDENVLCVGALIPGIVNDQIAYYSNFGDRVDVYAHESYIGLCPNGTSCATPAVSAAATVIAAKHPELTPAQIKQAIVEASEERELEVGGFDPEVTAIMEQLGTHTREFRKVRVFNPPAMLGRALEIARQKAGK